MSNTSNNNPQQERNPNNESTSSSGLQSDQNQVVNEQDQTRVVNTGSQDYKENVTGRTPEKSPTDLNLSDSDDMETSDSEGGAEIETPHRKEGADENSTERKLPKM